MPKSGTFYHPVDTWSSTVAEAEEHARFHAVDDGPDYDHYDWMEDEEEEDTCGCSDPGCPCDGPKRGGPP